MIPAATRTTLSSYRFAAPIENTFYTFTTRIDYNLTASGNHKLFGRFGTQDDTINDHRNSPVKARGGSGC